MKMSWLKLDVNILNDDKIRIIRKLPDGDKLFVFWIGLLTQAMKSRRPGIITLTDKISYSMDQLADLLEIPVNVIKLGIQTFTELEMLEIENNGAIKVVNFNIHQNTEKYERMKIISKNRQKRYRERQKKLLEPGNKTVTRNGYVTLPLRNDKVTLQNKNKSNTKKERERGSAEGENERTGFYPPAITGFMKSYREYYSRDKINHPTPNAKLIQKSIEAEKDNPDIPAAAWYYLAKEFLDKLKMKYGAFEIQQVNHKFNFNFFVADITDVKSGGVNRYRNVLAGKKKKIPEQLK